MSEKPVALTYTRGRGLAEPIRMLLFVLGIKFEEKILSTREDFEKLRNSGALLFGQVPLLEINGLKLTQSKAILRYLAREHKLEGDTSEHKVLADMTNDAIFDFRPKISGIQGAANPNAELENLKKVWIPRFLPYFENLLQNNGKNGHLVGTKLTFVDVVLFETLQWLVEVIPYGLDAYPATKHLWQTIGALDSIKSFLSSPYRKLIPDDAYLKQVREIFPPLT